MWNLLKRASLVAAVLLLATAVFALGREDRRLRATNRDLEKRYTEPHRGFLVPAVAMQSLDGERVAIGQNDRVERQVLFFFSIGCRYCLSSLRVLRALDSTLKRSMPSRAALYAVALDSPAVVRHFVDSMHLSVPVLLATDWRIPALYRVKAVPQLIVVDSSGRTTYARAGDLAGPGILDSVVAGVSWEPRSRRSLASGTPR